MCFWIFGGPERPKLPLRVKGDRWVGYCRTHGHFINTRRGYTSYMSGHLYLFGDGTYLDCPTCEAIKYSDLNGDDEP